MQRLRLATPEEIEGIRETSDLDASCVILALDTQAGTALAVVRCPVEVDPVYFPKEFTDRLKLFFMRDIETYLSTKGFASYYFNILADQEDAVNVMKNWGAEVVSKAPELRLKMNL